MLKKLQNRLNESKGFTLVELIVVIAIMVILIALLVPNVVGYISSSQTTANLSAAKSIYNAANTCVVNGKASTGTYPNATAVANLMSGKEASGTGSTEKLVTVPTGTSATIYYDETKGVVEQVIAASVNGDVTATDASASNQAVYDPEKSGNAYETSTGTWTAPSGGGIKAIDCKNGADWTATP